MLALHYATRAGADSARALLHLCQLQWDTPWVAPIYSLLLHRWVRGWRGEGRWGGIAGGWGEAVVVVGRGSGGGGEGWGLGSGGEAVRGPWLMAAGGGGWAAGRVLGPSSSIRSMNVWT